MKNNIFLHFLLKQSSGNILVKLHYQNDLTLIISGQVHKIKGIFIQSLTQVKFVPDITSSIPVRTDPGAGFLLGFFLIFQITKSQFARN